MSVRVCAQDNLSRCQLSPFLFYFIFCLAMSNWQAQNTEWEAQNAQWDAKNAEWKRWYPSDDVFLMRKESIMAMGLPCTISVKHKKEDWGRITLVLAPQTG